LSEIHIDEQGQLTLYPLERAESFIWAGEPSEARVALVRSGITSTSTTL
jgi:hypothetical protein